MEQYYHLIFLFALIALFKVGFLPYVRQSGYSSWNNLAMVNIQEEARLKESGNDKEGVTAQERSEWLLRIIVPGFLLAWVPFVTDWYWWILLTLLGTFWAVVFEKAFDSFGHTCEILEVGTEEYEAAEIRRMKKDKSFSNMSLESIQEMVNNLKGPARLWKKVML